MRVQVFEDSNVHDAFDHRSRLRSTDSHHHKAIFLRYVWGFILPGLGSACSTVFEDNKWARHLAHNPVCASNSKHIDISNTSFLRELVFREEFDIVAVEFEQQHADVLAKALAGPVFRFHRDFVMNI